MDWQPVQGAPHILPKHSWENQSVFYIWKNLSRGEVGWNNLAARPCLTFDFKKSDVTFNIVHFWNKVCILVICCGSCWYRSLAEVW